MKIDKHIPLPKPRAAPGALKALILKMRVGDSVIVANPNTFKVTAWKQKDRKFTIRKTREGTRAWRIA